MKHKMIDLVASLELAGLGACCIRYHVPNAGWIIAASALKLL